MTIHVRVFVGVQFQPACFPVGTTGCLGDSLVLRSIICYPVGAYCTNSSTPKILWFCGSWSSPFIWFITHAFHGPLLLCFSVFLWVFRETEKLCCHHPDSLSNHTSAMYSFFKYYIVFYNLCHEWNPTLLLNMWQEILPISSFFSPAFQARKLRLAFCISSYLLAVTLSK